MIDGSDEFIKIQILGDSVNQTISEENMSEADVKAIYGNNVNAGARIKIEKRKAEIEQARVSIIKQVSADINESLIVEFYNR